MCALLSDRDVEKAFWAQAVGSRAWRSLYDNPERGVSVDWHEFSAKTPIDWSPVLRPDSIVICFNHEGAAQVSQPVANLDFRQSTVAYFRVQQHQQATRLAAQRHRFLTITLSLTFVRALLTEKRASLSPGVSKLIFEDQPFQVSKNQISLSARPMRKSDQDLSNALLKPGVESPALSIFYEAKIMEMASLLFFTPEGQDSDFFCLRQKRVASDRIQKACRHLSANLENPPNLEQLGRQIGCSSYYLSRLFSQAMGMTISQYIRHLRVEEAAKLLASGRFNVSEAAIEVGYQSLSHFSKAFREVKGCHPSNYKE